MFQLRVLNGRGKIVHTYKHICAACEGGKQGALGPFRQCVSDPAIENGACANVTDLITPCSMLI